MSLRLLVDPLTGVCDIEHQFMFVLKDLYPYRSLASDGVSGVLE
jgi:hypothetical protein